MESFEEFINKRGATLELIETRIRHNSISFEKSLERYQYFIAEGVHKNNYDKILTSFFLWAITPEGSSFWHDIYLNWTHTAKEYFSEHPDATIPFTRNTKNAKNTKNLNTNAIKNFYKSRASLEDI